MKLSIREKIDKAIIEKQFVKRTFGFFFKKIRNATSKFWKNFRWLLKKPAINSIRRRYKIDENTIVFISSRGAYDCNPKAICQEIIDQNLPYRLVYVARKIPKSGTGEFPLGVKLVKRDSYEFYIECAKAKIIIDNSVSMDFMRYKKKKGQILIETWHGAIGMKAFSKELNNDKEWVKHASNEAKATDYCISNSKFETDLFKNTFWPNAEILEYGHARNDVLFSSKPKLETLKNTICKKYKIPTSVHICLYAPTYRDDNDMSPYIVPYKQLKKALSQRFGGEWVIFTRYHLKVRKMLKDIPLPDDVINVSNYHDIQDLAAIIDCGITDYSSWICEYMLTKRPGFLFATDADDFLKNQRALVYPLDSTPFPLAKTTKELIDNILAFDNKKFVQDCDAFLEKYQCYDDGYASKKAVEKIKVLMRQKIK